MRYGPMGEGFAITLAGMGIVIERENEDGNHLTVWISVPETADHVDAHGNEMAGAFLAKRMKTSLTNLGVKNLIVKYRIRKGEHWTKQMGKDAEWRMKKMLFGSQA